VQDLTCLWKKGQDFCAEDCPMAEVAFS